jgi:two-component system sensor histidine kinase AtoS
LDYRNEGQRKLAVTTSLLTDARAEIIGVLALFSDITEKKELERQLERSERLAYMGEMAASIAHEIKNPIGSIRLFVDALARDFSNPTAQKNFKEVIPQEVENIDRMVRDLLFLARPPSLKKVHLDLTEIIRITLQFCSEDAISKGITLNMDGLNGPVQVLADGEKLKQALRNIVLNAIEAVPSEKGEISVSLALEARTARVNVADNGPGIAQEDLLRLFHPFYTTKHGGTGLGLAIANRIVEDHEGSIEVTSNPGTGTTFSIILPR